MEMITVQNEMFCIDTFDDFVYMLDKVLGSEVSSYARKIVDEAYFDNDFYEELYEAQKENYELKRKHEEFETEIDNLKKKIEEAKKDIKKLEAQQKDIKQTPPNVEANNNSFVFYFGKGVKNE